MLGSQRTSMIDWKLDKEHLDESMFNERKAEINAEV